MIRWTTVESSAIARIGHDGHNLFVKFNGRDGSPGSIYEYFDVPERIFTDFLEAHSKGRFHDDNILGKYRYQKMSLHQPSSTQFFQHDMHQ